MTTFHSRQSGDARRTRKNENADTFNFASQIPPSICAVMHTKHDKSRCNNFQITVQAHGCQQMLL